MGTESLLVYRDELGLPPLELVDPAAGYEVDGAVAFAGVAHDRTYAPTVPWLDHERVKHVRRTNGTYTLSVIVSAPEGNGSALVAREDALVDAFGQVEFRVVHTIDGTVRAWWCMAGDLTVGDAGEIDETWHGVGLQVWHVTGPHRGRAPID